MTTSAPLACVTLLASTPFAVAQGLFPPLQQFQPGQVASAGAVNDTFRALQAQAVKLQRPAFIRKPNEPLVIVIPATAAKPATVAIDSFVLSFTQDFEISLQATGRGGIDTGTVQANSLYYLYAVLGAGGPPTVSATVSLSPPTQGPFGFATQWTYLGSFVTDGSSVAPRFTFSKGRCSRFRGPETTTQSTTPVAVTVLVPPHATEVHGRFGLSGVPQSGNDRLLLVGPNANNIQQVIVDRWGPTPPLTTFAIVSVPLFDGAQIVMQVNDSFLLARFESFGWTEDPTVFQ